MSIKSIDPNAWALISAALALDLAQSLDLEEQDIIGNLLASVGSMLLTIAAAEEAQKKAAEEKGGKKEEHGQETKSQKEQVTEGKSKTKTEGIQPQPPKSDHSHGDEDKLIRLGNEDLHQRIEWLERQVREMVLSQERLVEHLKIIIDD